MAAADHSRASLVGPFQFWRYRLGTLVRQHNRIAAQRGDSGEVSLDQVIDMLSRQRWLCVYCRANLQLVGASLDHIEPASRGGTHCIENLQGLCQPCNSKKNRKTDAEFRLYLAQMHQSS